MQYKNRIFFAIAMTGFLLMGHYHIHATLTERETDEKMIQKSSVLSENEEKRLFEQKNDVVHSEYPSAKECDFIDLLLFIADDVK